MIENLIAAGEILDTRGDAKTIGTDGDAGQALVLALEAFRLRSEHAASIDAAMREAIAARLVEEYGGAKEAADAVWVLARETEWYREGELAERFLVERFDIRESLEDKRLIALEDFASVLDLPTQAKYGGTIERAVKAVGRPPALNRAG